jgi:Tfp pilus assembly protein PilN
VTQQVNLYNPLFEKKKKPFSALTMSQTLGFVAVGLAVLYGYAAWQMRSAERLAAPLKQQLDAQRERVAELAKAAGRTPSKAIEAQVAQLQAEVLARQTTLQALSTGELGNTAGFSEFFAALGRQATPGVWLTAIRISDSGNELQVQGKALRAELMPAFLRALSKESVMRGRRVTEMKLTAKTADKPSAGKPGDEGPEAFIEFSFTAPVQLAEAPAAASQGTP